MLLSSELVKQEWSHGLEWKDCARNAAEGMSRTIAAGPFVANNESMTTHPVRLRFEPPARMDRIQIRFPCNYEGIKLANLPDLFPRNRRVRSSNVAEICLEPSRFKCLIRKF